MVHRETLLRVLCQMLGKRIVESDCQTRQLQGGTLGDVQLITGTAQSIDGEQLPYKLVWKTQQIWERPGDPNSWHREYDLYCSDLDASFSDSFRWPTCYYAQRHADAIEIWMEYIEGISGNDLTTEMHEAAALEIGRYQGRQYVQPTLARSASGLGDAEFMQREHAQWYRQLFTADFLMSDQSTLAEHLKQMLRDKQIVLQTGKSFEYGYLRSAGCGIPEHLRQMLIDMDDRHAQFFENIKSLPVVLCHRDFWNTNIFYAEGKIRLIDWDTSGWGYLGEDIASLIVDGTEIDRVDECYQRLFPAYLQGISEAMDISQINDFYLRDMILIKFGYRMLQDYIFSSSSDVREEQVEILQKIYEWGK